MQLRDPVSIVCFSARRAWLGLLTIVVAGPVLGETLTTLPIYRSETVSGISGRVFADSNCPVHLTNMSVFGWTANGVSQAVTSWNLGAYTGVTSPAPLGNHQRGIHGATPGSCAVQMVGTQVGVVVNTASIPGGSDYRYKIANGQVKYVWDYDDNVRPWAYSTSAFNMSFDAQVPRASVAGGACGYVTAGIRIMAGNRKTICVQTQVFDTRGTSFVNRDMFGWDDKGTNTGFVAGYYSHASKYCSPLPGSSSSTGTPWRGWRYYGFSISRAQLLNAINSINTKYQAGLSEDPADYRLILMDIEGEVYPSVPGVNATLAMGVDKIALWQSGVPIEGHGSFRVSPQSKERPGRTANKSTAR